MRAAITCAVGLLLTIGCAEPPRPVQPDNGDPSSEDGFVSRSVPISGVGQLQGKKSASTEGPVQQGELQINDYSVAFKGDGAATATQVMGRALEALAKTAPELALYASAPEAHYFCASKSLAAFNQQLGADPDQPIPAGTTFKAGSVSDLKAMLAPFKNNLGQLREMVAESKAALGGKSKTTGHGVYSKPQQLPVGLGGPDAGGEPPPVMGDLSALGSPKKK